METSKIQKFARFARRSLIDQVSGKLDHVLRTGSVARREKLKAVMELEKQIEAHGREAVIEKVAYLWFNRFCALRFMDVNHYTPIGILSPVQGQFQPEVLSEAKMGHIDKEMIPESIQKEVVSLLSGSSPSHDPQSEAYRQLVVGACNYYHKVMPYLFERIADYTELLMPEDLLSGNSILSYVRESMTPDLCQNVEIIGWLYQFYISEKKDEVFEGLRKNRKVTPENIPAATQLFTPHWIVRYLVENSLGRLWMLNRPSSRLVEKMDYYIRPENVEKDFLRIDRPEEIRICDPACGSGHMLVYAFDLLYSIYEEEGYDPLGIPEKILTHNLYGIEIDERAGELAAFALTMKARAKLPRFFLNPVEPNICVLENIHFDKDELDRYFISVGKDLLTDKLKTLLHQFEEANNFGSLIRPVITDVQKLGDILDSKRFSDGISLNKIHQMVRKVLLQAEYLYPKYHVVIANPPYMGSRNMNERLSEWARKNYPDSKSDLFSMFVERNLELTRKQGMIAMITMQSWMFLSSFATLRTKILDENTILSMVHLGSRAFDSIGGEVVSTTAFVIESSPCLEYKGAYLRLTEGSSELEKEKELKIKREKPFLASSSDFKKIPGSPIAYWVSEKIRNLFMNNPAIGEIAAPRKGNTTTDNARFLRFWPEVNVDRILLGSQSSEPLFSARYKWVPYNKGGGYRKWFGFNEFVVNWQNGGAEIKRIPHSVVANEQFFFKQGLTWSTVTSAKFSIRRFGNGYIFDNGGCCVFGDLGILTQLLGFMNSKVFESLYSRINPTLNFQSGEVAKVPFIFQSVLKSRLDEIAGRLIDLGKVDWDSYETSWDFTHLPLLKSDYRQQTLQGTYQTLRAHWREMTQEMKRLEEENNRIFIDAYGLQGELTSDVSLSEITLTCNPNYRYGGEKTEEELESLLLGDSMRELISYAVGCMFGRYALETPGLILANGGESLEDYLKKVPETKFMPVADNVIPVMDNDWFSGDIVERFRSFLRVTFGAATFSENLEFIEKALGKKGNPRTIRDYFFKDFYSDHVKRYKKRPIYWLFSSSGGSFGALVYMHRMCSDTVSVVLNNYLREFGSKLIARKAHLESLRDSGSASSVEKTRAIKEIEVLKKKIEEVNDYEREVLYPLATRQIVIDLDDGVKVNYGKFGGALKKIPGMQTDED